MHRNLKSWTKWMIWATGLILSIAVEVKFYSDRQQAGSNFRRECNQELHKSAVNVAAQFHALYADLRTIARMPTVRASHLNSTLPIDDLADVRELYASMAESTPVRVVRLVPTPSHWHSKNVGTLRLSSKLSEHSGIEYLSANTNELKLIRNQMWLMPQTSSGWNWDDLQEYPVYSCRPMLMKLKTVDNGRPMHDFFTYYSVPVYSDNSTLWGAAVAELPFSTLTRLLPTADYNLMNPKAGINVHAVSTRYEEDDPMYKDQVPLSIHDQIGQWRLQFSVPTSVFNARPDMRAAQEFRGVAHILVLVITVAAFFVFSSLYKRRNELEDAKESLEIRVAERTNELAEALRDAKDASRVKGEFLANMSHEIRTPMNGVMAMTELLVQTKLDDEQQDLARTISSSAESLLTIINDVLDFSKIEARKLILEQTDFDLASLFEDVVKLHAPAAFSKGIELVADLHPSTETYVVGDPVRIRQVASNLLGNAIKFTDHGSVTLTATITGEEQQRLRFSVKDTGVGIPANRIDAIFESFTQSDASTTRKFGGTGLGLTICRHLSELMDGSIGVQSKLGRGSEFFVNIRIRESDLELDLSNSLSEVKKRILVCDDFETSLRVVSRQLESCGHTVVQCSSADQVLKTLESDTEGFDVLIIDQTLEKTGGLGLCQKIRRKGCAKNSLVLLTICVPTGLTQVELDKAGIAQVLSKPIRRDSLYKAIRAEQIVDTEETETEEVPVVEPSRARAEWLNVFLVEDNPVNQKVAKKLLNNLGCTVTVANDGMEALNTDLKQFDVILMDCQMPRLDGLSATRQIRHLEQRTGEHSIIIALTANAMAEDRVACIESGMDEYLAKPLRQKELEDVLRRMTENREAA